MDTHSSSTFSQSVCVIGLIQRAMPANADIPVVMVTGKHERGLVKECLQAGACDFVVKLFDRPKLLGRIELALGRTVQA